MPRAAVSAFRHLFVLCCFILSSCLLADSGTITIAQWNTGNFYDFEDDPQTKGDDGFTPSGWSRWTERRYRIKVSNIAKTISQMKADIICLEEIENRRVLEDLSRELKEKYSWPMEHIIHKDSKDLRGIDCAILSRFKEKSVKWINTGYGQRPSPCAQFAIGGNNLVVIGNHWRSRMGERKIADAKREVNADKVRAEYLKRLRKDPGLALVVAGDFNDNFTDRIPVEAAFFRTNITEVLENGEMLFCLSSLLGEDKSGTFFYAQTKRWNSFDTINISRGLLPEGQPQSPWVADLSSYCVYATDEMRRGEFGAPFATRRVGTRDGHYFEDGFSDHFPVMVKLHLRGKEKQE